jgi:hypothetical protein
MPGFPIRTPWDHSLVDSSPRPIAASHVLHRLLVPRHPPFALDNLTTKMLASTVQFSTNDQPTTHSATPDPTTRRRYAAPGHAWQSNPRSNNPWLFLQDPTGCHPPSPSRTSPPVPTPPQERCTRLNRPLPGKNSPVSPPSSTPPSHSDSAGSLPPFGGRCSLERR